MRKLVHFLLHTGKPFNMVRVINQETVFRGKLVIQKGNLLDDDGKKYSRLRVHRQDASAVLILNTDTNKLILTRQFRYAVHPKTKEPLLEIVAGKIDKKESPVDAAIREVEEEVGYRIKREHIRLLNTCFSSPGYTSERFFIYFARVTNKDKVAEGGGITQENEKIEVVEISIKDFKSMLAAGKIDDAKTYLAGLLMPEVASPLSL